jgi:hypothetical protein
MCYVSTAQSTVTYRADSEAVNKKHIELLWVAAVDLPSFVFGSKLIRRIKKRVGEQCSSRKVKTSTEEDVVRKKVFRLQSIHGISLSWDDAERLLIETRLNSAPYRRTALDFEEILLEATELQLRGAVNAAEVLPDSFTGSRISIVQAVNDILDVLPVFAVCHLGGNIILVDVHNVSITSDLFKQLVSKKVKGGQTVSNECVVAAAIGAAAEDVPVVEVTPAGDAISTPTDSDAVVVTPVPDSEEEDVAFMPDEDAIPDADVWEFAPSLEPAVDAPTDVHGVVVPGGDATPDVVPVPGVDATPDVEAVSGGDATPDVVAVPGGDATPDVEAVSGGDATPDFVAVPGGDATLDVVAVPGGDATPADGGSVKKGRPSILEMFPEIVACTTDFMRANGFAAQGRRRNTTGRWCGVTVKQILDHVVMFLGWRSLAFLLRLYGGFSVRHRKTI